MNDDRAHILVMDDAQEIVDLLRDLLEDERYRVSTAIFVLDLTRVKELAPDVIVLDIMFAGQNKGWSFLTMARLDPQVRQVPIILCTAAVDTVEKLAEPLERLDVQVVSKPFELDQLTDAIGAALPPSKRRAARWPPSRSSVSAAPSSPPPAGKRERQAGDDAETSPSIRREVADRQQ